MSDNNMGRVRIWDKDFNCLADESAQDGETLGQVTQRAIDSLADTPPERHVIGVEGKP